MTFDLLIPLFNKHIFLFKFIIQFICDLRTNVRFELFFYQCSLSNTTFIILHFDKKRAGNYIKK
ncbi:hypothetical protein BK133_28465 [Paenibacillus sp. FSL H8-0548]|nr:hypothetical protein BK133_28465 [Paenibacillus sp. FSL H8-0548]